MYIATIITSRKGFDTLLVRSPEGRTVGTVRVPTSRNFDGYDNAVRKLAGDPSARVRCSPTL